MGQSSYVHLEGCEVLHITDAAIKVRWEDEEVWFPLSHIAGGDAGKLKPGDREVTLSVTEWIARQKGIEVE